MHDFKSGEFFLSAAGGLAEPKRQESYCQGPLQYSPDLVNFFLESSKILTFYL